MDAAAFTQQKEEFDACVELTKQFRRLEITPIVDDDYPEVRHCYEGALRAFLRACVANGRALGDARGLTFTALRVANVSRCTTWHGKLPALAWSLSEWAVATTGELGEACNVIKKLNREREGLRGNGTVTQDELRVQLAKEIADTAIYLDLLASAAGVNLGDAIIAKFNEVSERNSFAIRLAQ